MKKLIVFLILAGTSLFVSWAVGANIAGDSLKQHAAASERLRDIMQNINFLVQKSNSPQFQPDQALKEEMAELVTAIKGLLLQAELMAFLPQEPGMSETRMVVFRALAGQLYTEALNLQLLTKNYDQIDYDYSQLDTAFYRLDANCQACHDMFRDEFRIEDK